MKHKSTPATQPRLHSVDEFCASHGISRAFFNKLVKQGDAPDVVRIGSRVLIAPEAASAWRDKHTVRATA